MLASLTAPNSALRTVFGISNILVKFPGHVAAKQAYYKKNHANIYKSIKSDAIFNYTAYGLLGGGSLFVALAVKNWISGTKAA